MTNVAQNLFRASALLNVVSIPGHVKMGFDLVLPAIATISSPLNSVIAQRGAQNCWNYVNASLLVAALLNWQWSRTLGPKTTEEGIMMWTLAIAGAVSSWRFWQVGAYPPLGCLLVAPACSLVGWWLS